MNLRERQRGYVLVMTLLLLALAASAMARVAVQSHGRAMAALEAQERLQRRWGMISCQQALLPHADAVIRAAGGRLGRRTSFADARLRLGGQTFVLRFSDEQAKINVNFLAGRLKGEAFRQAIRRLFPQASAVRLSTASPAGRWASYGEIFGDVPPAALMGGGRRAGLGAPLTCWGDGHLNGTRASPQAVVQMAALVLPQAELEKFKAAQGRAPEESWVDLFTALKFTPNRRSDMEKLMTPESRCYSLWTVALDGARPRYRFAVAEGMGRLDTFEW
jgi:hypothetical protein